MPLGFNYIRRGKMKKISRLLLFFVSFAVNTNFYASSLICITPKQIGQSEITGHFDFEPEIYIPADKRHKGLSRFDLLPFTDRRKGDPDRYRAVNPKYVNRENGRYYFLVAVKNGTRYFDENLKDKGVLLDPKVKVDFTETKTVKTNDNKSEKYVLVKDKGFVPISALTRTPGEIRAGQWFQFPLKAGEHLLYDGMGTMRGKIAAGSVKLNYGQIKVIKGESYYYAFSTKITVGAETVGASGWLKAAAIKAGNLPRYDPEFVQKMQIPTAANDTFTDYEITGGNPREIVGKDENGKTKFKFGYADENDKFIAYKVLPKISRDESVAATDYLKRSDSVINLGFNVAGVSNDTFRIGGVARTLIFHRSSDKEATAAIDLFFAKDRDGEKIAGKMIFVYGFVDTPGGKRWGWIPLEALKLKS